MVSEGVCNFRGEWISKVHTLQSRLSSIISHKFSNHSSIFVNLWLSKVGVVFVSDCWFHALQKTMLFEGCLIFGDVFVFSPEIPAAPSAAATEVPTFAVLHLCKVWRLVRHII